MVIVDLTRLHYCLEYEYEQFKKIVIDKWKSIPELNSFVLYVIPQWFEGTFSNLQIFKTPPGFANTNNPMESFNKIIKSRFTNFEQHPLIAFILIVVEHLIPYYSENGKEFLFHRIPTKDVIKKAGMIDTSKFSLNDEVGCWKGKVHTHTINFELKSCSCRWFLAFAVCSHLISACDYYNQTLKGYTKPRIFVYNQKRGSKPKTIAISATAFASSPMPILLLPEIQENRQDLFLLNANNTPVPSLNVEPDPIPEPEPIVTDPSSSRITRSKVSSVKRLTKKATATKQLIRTPEKRKPGRPRKNTNALSIQ